jgi:hypothetical protein
MLPETVAHRQSGIRCPSKVDIERKSFAGSTNELGDRRRAAEAAASELLYRLIPRVSVFLDDFKVYAALGGRTWLGLRHSKVVLPVLFLQALPFLRLFRIENRTDLGVVFGVNCL